MTHLNMSEYSIKSVVVRGDTKNHRQELKKLGGRFNPCLKNPTGVGKLPGWIFSKKNILLIESYISEVNSKKFCLGFTSIDSLDVEVELSVSEESQGFDTSGSDTEEMGIELWEHELRIQRLEETYTKTKNTLLYISIIENTYAITRNTLCYISVGMFFGISVRMIYSMII
jgi:hypothetical protein